MDSDIDSSRPLLPSQSPGCFCSHLGRTKFTITGALFILPSSLDAVELPSVLYPHHFPQVLPWTEVFEASSGDMETVPPEVRYCLGGIGSCIHSIRIGCNCPFHTHFWPGRSFRRVTPFRCFHGTVWDLRMALSDPGRSPCSGSQPKGPLALCSEHAYVRACSGCESVPLTLGLSGVAHAPKARGPRCTHSFGELYH